MALMTGDEIVEIAMRLEQNGEVFYTMAAHKAEDATVKALFEDLAIQEQHHWRAFAQMGHGGVELALSPEQWDEFQAYTGALLQQSLFAKRGGALSQVAQAMDERQALQAALGFEKETLLFFHELQDVVRGTSQQSVERIIQEERRHIQRLSGLVGK